MPHKNFDLSFIQEYADKVRKNFFNFQEYKKGIIVFIMMPFEQGKMREILT